MPYIYDKVKVTSLNYVRLLATPWIVAHGIFQARILEWVAIKNTKKLPILYLTSKLLPFNL